MLRHRLIVAHVVLLVLNQQLVRFRSRVHLFANDLGRRNAIRSGAQLDVRGSSSLEESPRDDVFLQVLDVFLEPRVFLFEPLL